MALEPNQEIPPLSEALVGSDFEDSLECLERIFGRLSIRTVRDLDNSPRVLGHSLCGISTHGLIQHIRSYMEIEGELEGLAFDEEE